MKKLIMLIMVVLLAGFVVACGDNEETVDSNSAGNEEGAEANAGNNGEEAEDAETYIAIVSKGFQHQFWQAVQEGAEQAAEEFNVEITFEGPDDESQVDVQMDMLLNALDRGPDAIGFAALDSQASTSLLETAQERDIPVVAFDSGVDSDIPITTAATDNYAAAALAADKMAENIGGKGEVALVIHDQTSVTGVQRRDGFIEKIESDYPDIEIVDTQYGGGDHLESTNLAKTMMQSHPELAGIYGSNEGSAVGVVNAVKELDRAGDIVIIGFDSGQQQIDAIESGVMVGAVTQNPVGIGYETVKAAVDALNGEEVPELIDTGFLWFDAENMQDEEVQAAIYE
ncbi:BMP family ABC transporter substrate-binding protein [Salipaludibacillus neizhouensis]|uniref:BMP family ABC transporter substrate-binding protein n=1 Tax=Salipaludibacillus neizhouensis TaxID=885475 RepID=A0A3A9KF59_9BACI|nr:ABC transporter substrate-binding protein [Salipaludibacillus neizhouensis]RKL66215.1 BMP family ABC transporter substrate-binding protein [Salipaludibacillus neizhouensis]